MTVYRVIVQGPNWDQHKVCWDRDSLKEFSTTDLQVARDYRDEIQLSLKQGALTAFPVGEYRYYVAKEVTRFEEILA